MKLIAAIDKPINYTLEINGSMVSGILNIPDKLATALPVYYDSDPSTYLGKLPAAKFPALPASGWLEAGAIYQYDAGLVMVCQSHSRMIYPPDRSPALFLVYRAGGSAGGVASAI